jgi:hypothetical protein
MREFAGTSADAAQYSQLVVTCVDTPSRLKSLRATVPVARARSPGRRAADAAAAPAATEARLGVEIPVWCPGFTSALAGWAVVSLLARVCGPAEPTGSRRSGDRTGALSPTWGPTPPAAGVRPPNPCWVGNFGQRGAGSFRTGWGSVRLRPPKPAPDRPPPTRARQGQRVRTTIGEGKPGTGPDRSASKNRGRGLKNLRGWSQLLDGRTAGTGGAASGRESLRRRPHLFKGLTANG